MLEIRRGTAAEFDKIIDFIDFVFSKDYEPHDFINMYPNLYRRTDESMHNMVNLWDGDELRGSVIVYPRYLSVGGKTLSVYGIGNVSCHPRFRGKGYMTMLMNYINEEAKKNGVQLMNLGGRRDRYNHFGFEIAGNCYQMHLERDFVLKALPGYDGGKYTFEKFGYDDRDIVDRLHKIYLSKPAHYEYDYDDFFLRLVIPCDGAYPLAVRDKNKKLIGYLAVCPERERDIDIREICLEDDDLTDDVLISFIIKNDYYPDFKFSEAQLPYVQKIIDLGGDVVFRGNGMWEVFDWKNTIDALLSYKASYSVLKKGTLVFDIENSGRYAVSYDGEKVSVTETTADADFELSALKAIRALLGSTPSIFLGLNKDEKRSELVRSWLPLPLTWFGTERV
ncbi:MAG: GNAT family N-acetyltransferase [Clostridiales bacterium]|nr:GNAT family N-acetyltransferase [Clostridiales bacterium]